MANKFTALIMLFVVAAIVVAVNGQMSEMDGMAPMMAPTPAPTSAGFSLAISPVAVAFSIFLAMFLRH
uniref:Transmembrane protein n=1 Tax=Chenopodium quinoa TaxID=63459 RepID=A0A803MA66_CHEQI